MRLSAIFASTLAIAAQAAPTNPKLNLKDIPYPVEALDQLSSYFNLVAAKVQMAKFLDVPPICDLSKAQMPVAPDALPPPAAGLTVRHVAVGRGTQNYTCDAGNATATPALYGAKATLFNATCMAALYPDVLDKIPGMAVHFDLDDAKGLGPSPLEMSGVHYFRDAKTPFFDLNTDKLQIGVAPCAKANATAAPSTAAVGQQNEGAVSWLKLNTVEGATGNMKEVYRVTTAGGDPPATCKDMPATFEVQYSAVYWFWEGDVKPSSA